MTLATRTAVRLLIGGFLYFALVIPNSAQALRFYSRIDMPPCPTGTTTAGLDCDTVFEISNTSTRSIDVLETRIESGYSWDIVTKGNYFYLWNPIQQYVRKPWTILPGASLSMTLYFCGKYVDSISKNGRLDAKMHLLYAYSDDTTTMRDSILLSCKVIDGGGKLRSSSSSTMTTRICPDADVSDTSARPLLQAIGLHNPTISDVTIDSIGIISGSNMFTFKGVAKTDEPGFGDHPLPFVLQRDRSCNLYFRNALKTIGDSRAIIAVYVRDMDSGKREVLIDSLRTHVSYLEPGYCWLDYGLLKGTMGQSAIRATTLRIITCGGEELTVDSITTSAWSSGEVDVIPAAGVTFPLRVLPQYDYALPVFFTPRQIGRKRGFLRLHCRAMDSVFTRMIRLTTIAESDVSGFEQEFESSRVLRAFPNPADNIITIRWAGSTSPIEIVLFDSMGRKVESTITADGETKISVLGYASGVYLLVAMSNGVVIDSASILVHH